MRQLPVGNKNKKEGKMVKFDDFKKLELRIARIKDVELHPNADKLYVLKVDIGGEERQMVAGVREHYKPEELKGRNVVVIINIDPATIRGVESQGMMLAAKDSKGLSILVPDKEIETGSSIS